MPKEYSQAELERVIEETTRHGAVYANLFFDAHGKEEEPVKSSLIEFIDRLTKEKGVLYCKGEILPPYSHTAGDPKQPELIAYSTSAEIKILCENFNVLADLAMRYGPVGAEILAPSEIRLKLDAAQSLLLDASAQSQEYSAFILKKLMKPQDMAEFEEKMKRRAEIGKQLLEKQKE